MNAHHKVKTYFAKFSEDEILGMASALAFSIFSSIIPLVALAYFIFALFGGFQELRAAAEQYAFQYIAPSFADNLSQYIRSIEVNVSPEALGIFGIVGFLYAGLSMIGQAEWSLNKIWGALTPRTFIQRLLRYSSVVIAAPILLGTSLAMTSYLASKIEVLEYFSKPLLFLLTAIPYLFSSLLFSGIYYFLPNTKIDKRAAVIAGFCTGLTFELLKQGFAFYASYSLKNSLYGSLAALPIMVLWMYLVAVIFLAGGELCYFIDQRRKGVFHFAPITSLLSMAMLRDILKIYCDRKDSEPIGIKEVVRRLQWDQSVILEHIHFLVRTKILKNAVNMSTRSECFEAVDKDFGRSLFALVRELNKVRYEQVEIPAAPVFAQSSEQQRQKLAQKYWDSPIEVH